MSKHSYHPFEKKIKNGIFKYKMPKSTLDLIGLICFDWLSDQREYIGDDSLDYIIAGCTEMVLFYSVSEWMRKGMVKELNRTEWGNRKKGITEIRNHVSVSFTKSELAAIVSVISTQYIAGRIEEATMSSLAVLIDDIHKALLNGAFSKITHQYQDESNT